MKVLVIAQDGQLRDALEKQFKIRTRAYRAYSSVGPNWISSASVASASKSKIKRFPEGTGVVVNALSFEQVDESSRNRKELLSALESLAESCSKRYVPLIHLSDSRVFDGLESGVHKEVESVNPGSPQGKMLTDMEAVVSSLCDRHLVLRTGSVFSSVGDNMLTELLGRFEREETLALSNKGESCPIHASDMARVVSGVIDQLSCGAEAWGTYHYCSADYVTQFQFAEALWGAVSQYKKVVMAAPILEPADEVNVEWHYPLLNCEKMLNTFGIKQLPWRAFLAPTVKKYFNPELVGSEPVLTQSIQPVQKENFDG